MKIKETIIDTTIKFKIAFIIILLFIIGCASSQNNENNVVSDISTFIPNYTSYSRLRYWKIAQINIEVGKESYIAYFKNKDAMFLYVTENNKFGDPSIFKIYAINGLAMSLLKPAHGVRFSYYDATKLDYLKAQEYLNKKNAIEISY